MTKDRYFSAYFRPELSHIGEWGDMRPSGVNSDMERGRSVPCKTDRHNEETSVPTKTARGTLRRFLPTIRYGRQTDELQESSERLRQRGDGPIQGHPRNGMSTDLPPAFVLRAQRRQRQYPQIQILMRRRTATFAALPKSPPPLGRAGRSQPSTDTLKNSKTPTGPPLSSVTTIE